MLSSLCRQFTTACAVHTKSHLSASSLVVVPTCASLSGRCFQSSLASPKNKEEDEFVQVLKLNMLQDNPGAVKKVSLLWNKTAEHEPTTSQYLSGLSNDFSSQHNILLCPFRNVVLEEVLVLARERRQGAATKVKRLGLEGLFHLDSKVGKPNSLNCSPNEDSPTRDTKPICWPSILEPFKIILIWDG
jgi:hypothetical protein